MPKPPYTIAASISACSRCHSDEIVRPRQSPDSPSSVQRRHGDAKTPPRTKKPTYAQDVKKPLPGVHSFTADGPQHPPGANQQSPRPPLGGLSRVGPGRPALLAEPIQPGSNLVRLGLHRFMAGSVGLRPVQCLNWPVHLGSWCFGTV